MKVMVLLDFVFHRTSDGAVWTPNIFGYSFWQRYLRVFDGVKVAAVIKDIETVPGNWKRADGEHVSFCPIPCSSDFVQCMMNSGKIRRTFRDFAVNDDAVICRVPVFAAHFLVSLLNRSRKPYGLEVTTDPRGFYAPGAVKHPLRPFLRWYYTRLMRNQCAGAYAAAYVTEKALQKLYPPGGLSTFYSNVELSTDDINPNPGTAESFRKEIYEIVFVGSLNNYVKAPDVLLEAFSLCINENKNIRLSIIGDGHIRPEIEKLLKDLSLGQYVKMPGNVSSKQAMFKQLDASDLFVLPSRTDTMPRAMIEAMARGLPCIGSDVDGIPELLSPQYLFPANNAEALAGKILEVLNDPEQMSQMSIKNLEIAAQYTNDKLDAKRTDFFTWIHAATDKWCNNN